MENNRNCETVTLTAQKMKCSIKDFFSKCDQIRSFLRIWSHLLKKSLMKTSFFVQCLLKRNIAFLKNFIFFSKCNFSQKVDVVQKYLLGKSSSSVDIFILNNSSAKMVAFPKINYPKELSILKKWLLGRSFTLEK